MDLTNLVGTLEAAGTLAAPAWPFVEPENYLLARKRQVVDLRKKMCFAICSSFALVGAGRIYRHSGVGQDADGDGPWGSAQHIKQVRSIGREPDGDVSEVRIGKLGNLGGEAQRECPEPIGIRACHGLRHETTVSPSKAMGREIQRKPSFALWSIPKSRQNH
jgi:hypothetical protein